MDKFTLIWSVLIVGGVVALLLIGRFSRRSANDITTRGEHETLGELNRLEELEVGEMVEGQNVYRRARGDEEITAADAQAAGDARQRESIERATDE